MSEEKLAIEQMMFWQNHNMWLIVLMFVSGAVGRSLLNTEPFNSRRLAGEIILSVLGAITLYSFNLMQGMSTLQIIFLGGLASMGGVRSITWAIKFGQKLKASGVL